jgi:hypothetical protein
MVQLLGWLDILSIIQKIQSFLLNLSENLAIFLIFREKALQVRLQSIFFAPRE